MIGMLKLKSGKLRIILSSECNLNCFFCHREGLDKIELQENYKGLDDVVMCCGNGSFIR